MSLIKNFNYNHETYNMKLQFISNSVLFWPNSVLHEFSGFNFNGFIKY